MKVDGLTTSFTACPGEVAPEIGPGASAGGAGGLFRRDDGAKAGGAGC